MRYIWALKQAAFTAAAIALIWLAVPAHRVLQNAAKAADNMAALAWNENTRFETTHVQLNTAFVKIGSGVAQVGSAIDNGQKGINQNLFSVTDEKNGILATFNSNVATGLININGNLAVSNGTIAAAVYGAMNSYGIRRRGLLDLTESLSDTTDKVDAAFPGWNSRFMAVTGEGMRLLDASRKTMNQFEAATPKFLTAAQDTNEHISNIAGSFDRYVGTATAPKPWYKQAGTIGKVGMLACRLLCPQL